MKHLVLFAALLISTLATKATTLTLNNALPSPGQYTTWSAVHAAAANGDTILVQGSSINYYTLTVTKRLTIIGPGHNNADKQNPQKAFCDDIIFNTGSNGSKVYGMECNYVYNVNGNVDSIGVYNCRILVRLQHNGHGCNYWIVDGNVFTSTTENVNAQGFQNGDMTYRNNIFNGRFESFNGAYVGYNYILNNIFLNTSNFSFQSCNYFYINNNIFYRGGVTNSNNIGLVFNNNLSYQCTGGNTFPNGTTNYVNVDPEFETALGTGAFFSYATNYRLKSTSPVLTGGTDGTQLGVYGGSGDYNQGGVPRNPYIKTFNITGPSTINAGSNLQIYFKAKARN
jgi:hypothetical protein